MEEEVSVNSLQWCWVIETLARSQQVGAALLYELLSRAPPLSGKPGKEAREIVALRCLEEFFGPFTGSIDDHPASYTSNSGFNASDSCEAVLQRIVHESSGSDLQKDAPDELKCDVRAFIELKKATLPKCTLELLKSMIIEGTHPSLKELGKFTLRNQTIPSNGIDSVSTLPTVYENCEAGQAAPAEENGDSAKNGASDQLEQAILPNGNSPRCKMGTSNDQVQDGDDTTHSLDNQEPPLKKLKLDKQDGLQSQTQPSVPCDGSDMSSAAEGAQNRQCVDATRNCNGTSNGEILVDLRKSGVYYNNQPRTPHDKDGLHPKETDIAGKMLAFLSSRSSLPYDSPVMTETEVNLCMKCNKGGELLICDANTCPLAFHESCLRCSASFDDQGKFYCPFCAYSRAISEYAKAKEKVSLARKELSMFIGGKISCQAEPDSTTASEDDANRQRRNEDINKTTEPTNSDNVVTKVANRRQLRSSKNKHREVPPLPANVAENAFITAAQNLSPRDRQGAEVIAQLPRDTIRILNQGRDRNTDDGSSSLGDEKITETSQKSSDLKRKKEATGHQAAELYADVNSESISDSDGLSEDEKKRTNTSMLSPTPLREAPATNQSRRKKVPWTAEEEAILKEGVQKFVQGDNKAIPWKDILEFGGSVFQKGRRAVDLKDKWRNIMRGSPKVK